MAYTVKQVAAMSGVSVRTLHFYDETGLLKPAWHRANGYRFYEEPQLLTLQQILFYRELGFELKRIKEVLGRADFEKVTALQSHRKVLQQNLTRTRSLIETIDKTIQHLKGSKTMKVKEMFAGFSVAAGDDRFGEHIKLGGPVGEPIDFNCQSGWPKHLHYEQDEWIYVIEGEFEFRIGDKQIQVRSGESVFIPRKVAHVWAGRGKIINMYQPAGRMEEFFRELSKPSNVMPTREQMANKTITEEQVPEEQLKSMHRFFDAHGMDLLGPPLGYEYKPSGRENVPGR
jgi:DNA-binding transcriptional MerR regulator